MPTVGTTSRPGYVYDQGTDTWIPIGVGPHSHDTDYVNQSTIDAKGDLIVGTADNAYSRLAVGANNTILTADSSTATGLKWAAPSGGALTWSLLKSGGTTLSGSAKTTISFSAQKQLFILYREVSSANASSFFQIRLNDDSGANYEAAGNYGRIYDPLQSDNTSQPWYVAGFTEIRGARMSTAASSQMWGSVAVYNADSTSYKIYTALGGGNRDGGNNAEVINQQGFYSGTSAVTSISFNSSTGNFDAGTVYVYGGV